MAVLFFFQIAKGVCMRRAGIAILVCVGTAGLMAMAVARHAAPSAAGWTYPVIKDYGRAWPLPQAAVQPEKGREYKVLFNLTRAGDNPSEPLPGLEHAARTLNVFSSLGVPPKNLHIVMVFHGPAASAAMNNAVYRAHFKVDNPNIDLIHQLTHAGVEAYLCGQALHEMNYDEKDILPGVKLATSAMVALVTYQNNGYALMPF
jgi:intracellular sulfur oxidation DsrE/DsrF family protein